MGPESILGDQLKFQSFKGKITEAPYVYMCFGFVFLLFFFFFFNKLTIRLACHYPTFVLIKL